MHETKMASLAWSKQSQCNIMRNANKALFAIN